MHENVTLISVRQLHSGFWAVFCNGSMYYAAAASRQDAERIAASIH